MQLLPDCVPESTPGREEPDEPEEAVEPDEVPELDPPEPDDTLKPEDAPDPDPPDPDDVLELGDAPELDAPLPPEPAPELLDAPPSEACCAPLVLLRLPPPHARLIPSAATPVLAMARILREGYRD